MTLVPTSHAARLLALVVACAALVVGGLVWVNATSDPHSEVVADSRARAGWKTIAYEGVQVEIPAAWERLDMGACEFQYEQWAPPDSPACTYEGGAAFYGSATFDPFRRPGVRRNTWEGTDEPPWGGYVYAGDFAVYASDADRDLVQQVLDSARVTGSTGSSDEGPALLEPRVTPDAPTGMLEVRFAYGERTSLYAEGARHYFQVLDGAGTVVLRRDQGTEQGAGSGYADSVRLAPGDYRVGTFQHGCDYTDGSRCETTLGPAQDRCAADVSVSADRTTLVSVTTALPHPCRVQVSKG